MSSEHAVTRRRGAGDAEAEEEADEGAINRAGNRASVNR